MAADYNKPVTTDDYVDILTQLRDNIAAAQNMLDDLTGVTNIPTGALRYDQTAKKFQIYNGTTFVDTVLSKEAGGTGNTNGTGTLATFNVSKTETIPVAKGSSVAGTFNYFSSGTYFRLQTLTDPGTGKSTTSYSLSVQTTGATVSATGDLIIDIGYAPPQDQTISGFLVTGEGSPTFTQSAHPIIAVIDSGNSEVKFLLSDPASVQYISVNNIETIGIKAFGLYVE